MTSVSDSQANDSYEPFLIFLFFLSVSKHATATMQTDFRKRIALLNWCFLLSQTSMICLVLFRKECLFKLVLLINSTKLLVFQSETLAYKGRERISRVRNIAYQNVLKLNLIRITRWTIDNSTNGVILFKHFSHIHNAYFLQSNCKNRKYSQKLHPRHWPQFFAELVSND